MTTTAPAAENAEVKKITSNRVEDLRITSIAPSPTNPRRSLGDLSELVASIAEVGVLQPVTARNKKRPGTRGAGNGRDYELIVGHRRLEAARKAGLETIPVILRDMTDAEVLEAQLVENVQRADIHAMDEAESYERLHGEHGLTVDDIAAKVGKSRSFIYGRMKLLGLSKKARKAFLADELSPSVALLLARIPVPDLQDEALDKINPSWRSSESPMSFREASYLITRDYMLRLDQAAFSKTSEELVPAAGSCRACPKRTGNQAELFEDVKSADVCTDPKCYRAKLDAHWILAKEKAAEAGDQVLPEAKAKKLFQGGTFLGWNSGYIDLNANCPHDPSGRKHYRAFLSKKRIEVPKTLARDGAGNIRELVEEKALNRALKDAGIKTESARARSSSAADKRYAAQQRTSREIFKRAIDAIGTAAGRRGSGPAFWRLLFCLIEPSVQQQPSKKVLDRLGIELKKRYWGDKAKSLEKAAAKMTEAQARAAVLALVLQERVEFVHNETPHELKIAASHFRVDLQKIGREVRAELAKKNAAKKKASRKTKRSAKASRPRRKSPTVQKKKRTAARKKAARKATKK